ncbi:hypothetical protein ScPMuIL_007915, partial [Solemya velum]
QISVSDFLRETWGDHKSPTTSTFTDRMGHCRNTVSYLEDRLDLDRSGLTKMKKSVKALYNSVKRHVDNETILAENLEKLGTTSGDQETEIDEAFQKFSRITKELSALMNTLTQNLNSMLLYPLDAFLKGDLKGVKGDLKKPFDKAWKDYESKFSKIEKEKKQQAKEVGMDRREISGSEIAEEMEKERKIYQYQMCEYLIKVNEIKTKKGVDLLHHLVEYYKAQTNFFQDGLKTINHFQTFVEELVIQLNTIKQRQDNERKQLIELREALKSSMTSYKEPTASSTGHAVYSLHQLQGNKSHGSEKSGYLLKKSEGKVRKVWQKRKCNITEGSMSMSHGDETKDPVKLNLLTCQVKVSHSVLDLLNLISDNRTYHFQADDQKNMEEWISVLNNAKEEVLLKAFHDTSSSQTMNKSVRELTTSIIDRIRWLPGNKICCDCGAPDPEWLSTNLGILMCLECCGIHREMGVHISRTQSMVIDEMGTSKLLLARVVGNRGFNDIMEATVDPSLKPNPSSPMDDRREYIKAKYEQHRYAIITCTDKEELKQDLKQAVLSRDIFAMLQVHAEGLDLMSVLPDVSNEETALHLAVHQEDGTSLPLVDFIVQNSSIGNLDKRMKNGNTALHLCAELNRTECMKLLLRTKPDLAALENKLGQTAMEIAKDKNNQLAVELLNGAMSGKKDLFEHVNIDWDLITEDHLYADQFDYSDDDLESTPDKKSRSRPASLINAPDSPGSQKDSLSQLFSSNRDRMESDASLTCPPPPPPLNKPKIPGFNTSINNNNNNKLDNSLPNNVQSHSSGQRPDLPPLPPRGQCIKPPAPPPPPPVQSGHPKVKSEFTPPHAHRRIQSDTPFRPMVTEFRNTIHGPIGGTQVLPMVPSDRHQSGKPIAHPRPRASSSYTRPLSRSLDRSPFGSQSSVRLGPPPVPAPRPKKKRRYRALYDCEADLEDELTFREGEIILVLHEEEEDWWEGEIENHPDRKGLFPVRFVEPLPD